MVEAFKFEKEGFNSGLFIEGLEKSAFLCNSDKYSFIMNIRFMPEIQKNMMLEMFNAELESMNELVKDDELVNQSILDKYIINQYIQDLYRFYKIFPNRSEFADIFADKFELFESEIILGKWFNLDLYKNIGSLYFRQACYNETIKIFKILISKGLNEQNAFEKIAYSYQKLGDYNNALSYYKKSELFGTNMEWNYKKIALCYRVLNENDKALEYYLKCEGLEPENLYVHANIGHSYMRLKDFEGALKHYFKVEYFAPSNNKILRPIAWCSFALGKFDTSIKYYKKLILKNEATLTDYIALGNAYWCQQEIDGAIDSFRKGISIFSSDEISFKKDFLEEKEFLFKYGILQFEIELMLDFLFLEKVVQDII